MVSQDNYIFSILRSALFYEELPADVLRDWEEKGDELAAQRITGFAGDIPLLPDMEPCKTWRTELQIQRKRFESFIAIETKLYDLLAPAGIKFVILKGSAAARYYPHPFARFQNDIDFLVEKGKFSDAILILSQNGFEVGEDNGRHIELQYQGVHLEIHHKYALLPSAEASEKLDELLFSCMEEAEIYEYGDAHFPVLPPLGDGLVFLSHISQHLCRVDGIGLRHILDWLMFSSEVCDDEFWTASMGEAVRKLGLYQLAETITFLCQKYLGLDTRSHTWCSHADEALCDQLMEYAMAQGDLGIKRPQDDHGSRFFALYDTPLKFFKALQQIGCKTWKALEKYPWLRPFAWLYQLFRLIGRAFQHGYTPDKAMRGMSGGSKEVAMLKKLGVYSDSI